jgi:hypothetical protein
MLSLQYIISCIWLMTKWLLESKSGRRWRWYNKHSAMFLLLLLMFISFVRPYLYALGCVPVTWHSAASIEESFLILLTVIHTTHDSYPLDDKQIIIEYTQYYSIIIIDDSFSLFAFDCIYWHVVRATPSSYDSHYWLEMDHEYIRLIRWFMDPLSLFLPQKFII